MLFGPVALANSSYRASHVGGADGADDAHQDVKGTAIQAVDGHVSSLEVFQSNSNGDSRGSPGHKMADSSSRRSCESENRDSRGSPGHKVAESKHRLAWESRSQYGQEQFTWELRMRHKRRIKLRMRHKQRIELRKSHKRRIKLRKRHKLRMRHSL